MDLKKMKALLEKYYNGDTSIEEEKILKNYFERDDISEDFVISDFIWPISGDFRFDLAIELDGFKFEFDEPIRFIDV